MLKRLIALLAVLALMIPVAADAQTAPTLPSAEVDLWPEYDRPDMLVIYHFTLPSSVSLPYEMTVRIPSTGNLNAVAARQPDNTLFDIPTTPQADGNWSLIKFPASTPEVQVEYYDSGLQKNGADRHFVFNWPGDYAVDSLVIQVQQPVDATGMQISPSLGESHTGSDGLTYYTADEGAMKVGQSFTVTVDYKKPDDKLSGPTVQVQSSAPLSATPSSRFSWTSLLPWALGVLGLLLIAGGGVWYWWTGREKSAISSRRTRRKPAAAEADAAKADSGGSFVYCHNCGKRANAGDRFCRTCGTALRSGG